MRLATHFRFVAAALLPAAAWALLAVAAPARAACPGLDGGTLTWIVTNRPGGGYDAYSRLVQPFLERELGLSILVQNRPEAGGIVGAVAIRDADPDGRTLGLLNASGLLAANAVEVGVAPDPVTEFRVVGSIVSNNMVMFTGRDSGIADLPELLSVAQRRPLVTAVRDAGSASFYALPVTADLLGFDYELVTGYVGSAARTLAAMRGEVDVFLGHYDSLRGQVEAGELVPLLQLTSAPGDAADVPRLGGADGWARRRAEVTGRTPDAAERDAADLAAIVGAGRIVVAPRALPTSIAACLDASLAAVLGSPELAAAAKRARLGIEPRDGAATREDLLAAQLAIPRFESLVRAAVDRARE